MGTLDRLDVEIAVRRAQRAQEQQVVLLDPAASKQSAVKPHYLGQNDCFVEMPASQSRGKLGHSQYNQTMHRISDGIPFPQSYGVLVRTSAHNTYMDIRGISQPRAARELHVELDPQLQDTAKALGLTRAQIICLGLMLQRPWTIPAKGVAHAMGISTSTVRDHVDALKEKLNASDKWDLLEKAHQFGFTFDRMRIIDRG